MDSFKKLLTKIAGFSTLVFTYTILAARDLEFTTINFKTIYFERDPFWFILILSLFSIIPLVLVISSSLLYIGCNSTKDNWLSRKAKESAESYERAKNETDEYNS